MNNENIEKFANQLSQQLAEQLRVIFKEMNNDMKNSQSEENKIEEDKVEVKDENSNIDDFLIDQVLDSTNCPGCVEDEEESEDEEENCLYDRINELEGQVDNLINRLNSANKIAENTKSTLKKKLSDKEAEIADYKRNLNCANKVICKLINNGCFSLNQLNSIFKDEKELMDYLNNKIRLTNRKRTEEKSFDEIFKENRDRVINQENKRRKVSSNDLTMNDIIDSLFGNYRF